MKDITLNEVLDLKDKMKKDIEKIITNFEEKTGIHPIVDIKLTSNLDYLHYDINIELMI